MDLEGDDDWKISFNPRTADLIDVEWFLENMAPQVVAVEMKTPERYELTLDDGDPERPPMGAVIVEVIRRLGELFPDGVVVGHVDDESWYRSNTET